MNAYNEFMSVFSWRWNNPKREIFNTLGRVKRPTDKTFKMTEKALNTIQYYCNAYLAGDILSWVSCYINFFVETYCKDK